MLSIKGNKEDEKHKKIVLMKHPWADLDYEGINDEKIKNEISLFPY